MAFCPFAVQQIIPESHTQGRITPTTLIFHQAVSSADSLLGFWTTPGVELESHFYVGPTGTVYQFMDTDVRADANMSANAFAISVESWDDGNRDPLLGWNPAMVAACTRLAAWVCDTHGVRRGPAPAWDAGGIGGHNWFPGPWAGGPRDCPGVTRNAQLRNDIIPAVADGAGWDGPEEGDLSAEDTELLRQILNQLTGSRESGKFPGHPHWRYGKPAVSLTLVDYVRSIDRQVNSNLGLDGRPGGDLDDAFGQLLSLRAEIRAAGGGVTEDQIENIADRLEAVLTSRMDDLVDALEGLNKDAMREVIKEFVFAPRAVSTGGQ